MRAIAPFSEEKFDFRAMKMRSDAAAGAFGKAPDGSEIASKEIHRDADGLPDQVVKQCISRIFGGDAVDMGQSGPLRDVHRAPDMIVVGDYANRGVHIRNQLLGKGDVFHRSGGLIFQKDSIRRYAASNQLFEDTLGLAHGFV